MCKIWNSINNNFPKGRGTLGKWPRFLLLEVKYSDSNKLIVISSTIQITLQKQALSYFILSTVLLNYDSSASASQNAKTTGKCYYAQL